MYSTSDIVQRHRAVGIEVSTASRSVDWHLSSDEQDIRDLAIHIIGDAPPPNWLRIEVRLCSNQLQVSANNSYQNANLIPKVVTLLIPGLTNELLCLPPISTSPLVNPNVPIPIPLPSKTGSTTGVPFIASTFSHACPTRAPGDQSRMHSILNSFFTIPLSTTEKTKRDAMTKICTCSISIISNVIHRSISRTATSRWPFAIPLDVGADDRE